MSHAAIAETPLDRSRARTETVTAHEGACVIFEGIVRDHDHDRTDVVGLGYSAHPDAARILGDVVAEIETEFGVHAWAEHRVGELQIDDVALLAACAAAHRAEAFAACGALVDRIKERVPVWKHQRFADGTDEWVGLGHC